MHAIRLALPLRAPPRMSYPDCNRLCTRSIFIATASPRPLPMSTPRLCLPPRSVVLYGLDFMLVPDKTESFPYVDVLPFLAEHVQPSDQMLIFGCGTDLSIRLSRDGYGTRDPRSFMHCVDSNPERVEAMKAAAAEDPVCAENMANGRLRFETVDISTGIPELKQSSMDCVVDAGLLDDLLTTQGLDVAKQCLEAAHRAVRLGNPMVALSKIDKDRFAAIYDGNFGWVQELDGDPGAVSQWYRNKSGLKLNDVQNNLAELGISFFVYTNVDNC